MKNNLAIIFLIILCTSCSKAPDVKPNVQTTISGQFYDSFNQEPYPNIKVKIGEYQFYNYFDNGSSLQLVDYLDSTVTDANGNYNITFTTSGKGSSYYLEFKSIPVNYIVADKGFNSSTSVNYRSKQISNIGGNDTYNFEIFKQYYMQTRIVFKNNPFPPLSVNAYNGLNLYAGGYLPVISGANNDTIVNIPIQKNSGGFILQFYIASTTTKTLLYNPATIFLNPVINKDTITGGPYTLFPGTFR